MEIESDPESNLATLKFDLERIKFVEVERIKDRDDYYFCFAPLGNNKNVYFQKKTQLGIDNISTHQVFMAEVRTQKRPVEHDVVAGILGKEEVNSFGQWFKKWGLCFPQEKVFADALLGRSAIHRPDQLNLKIGDDESLLIAAMIIIKPNLEYLIEARKDPARRNRIDRLVQSIADSYDHKFRAAYYSRVLKQKLPSVVFPAEMFYREVTQT